MRVDKRLKRFLDALYEGYDFNARAVHDPIMFPTRYKTGEDVEAVGFLASAFAYGRVGQFTGVLERILPVLGERPSEFIREFDPVKKGGLFRGIKYRFNETEDIVCLIHVTGTLLRKYGSIERAFIEHYGKDDPNTGSALSGFSRMALEVDTSPVYGRDLKPVGFRQFFPSPRDGSACKRSCLYLRWMVRDRDIDFGIWKGTPKSRLVIPLDTHIMRVSRCLGFTTRRSGGWRTALEITEALRAFDPDDPLKYDFALCHRGIAGVCRNMGCRGCELRGFGHEAA
jgi:uncharacterized protein (TIGR02757 family)